MNFYLLKLLGKWFCFIAISISNLFSINNSYTKYEYTDDSIKNISVLTQIIPFETVTTYDSKYPMGNKIVTQNGKDGIQFTNNDGANIVLEEAISEYVIIGTGPGATYTGIITGYGPDCSTCSGRGYVACRTVDKKSFNLLTDGVYYEDSQYGSVRVLAAALSLFPCGTIVEVNSSTLGSFMGIVLDTGYDMRKNLERGIYHFDVAYQTENDEMVAKTTDMSGNVIYNIQRWGW